MDRAEYVRQLVRKHFWEMPDDASLTTGKEGVHPEDADDFLAEYAQKLQVDMSNFDFRRDFPNEGIPFLPNDILPKYLQTDHHQPKPLTIGILIKSGRSWSVD